MAQIFIKWRESEVQAVFILYFSWKHHSSPRVIVHSSVESRTIYENQEKGEKKEAVPHVLERW